MKWHFDDLEPLQTKVEDEMRVEYDGPPQSRYRSTLYVVIFGRNGWNFGYLILFDKEK